jgi:hypothetical protein
MKTNQLKPVQYSPNDFRKGSTNVAMHRATGSLMRLRLRAGLIAIVALALFGCSHGSSSSTYYPPSSNSTPTYSGANTSVQPTAQPAGYGSSDGAASTPSSGTQAGALPAAPVSDPAVNAFVRPALMVRQGQYFAWAMPMDWQAHESANGVGMASPDGKLVVDSELLVGSWGETTPWNFVVSVLTQVGTRDINGISTKNLPSVPSGYPGYYWQIQEFELTLTDASGIARQADWTCGICNAYGGYSAIIQCFSAPVGEFDRAKTWLPLLPQSVVVTNPGQVAYQDQIIPAQNHPLDNSGLMESWRQKQLSEDRIAKAQHEAMMGYERMVSPTTGDHYNMPLEAYDGTVGGYRDPKYPTEILKPTQPGE